MDSETKVLLFFFSFLLLLAFAIEENFRENRMYIEHGYHQTSSVGSTWVK